MATDDLRRAAEMRGRRAETRAALWLLCRFYRVIGRRVRTQAGEIDLIARAPSGTLCFIEVKARPSGREAAEAISHRQRARIVRAASLYLKRNPRLRHKGVRFDVILICPGEKLRHIKDAFQAELTA